MRVCDLRANGRFARKQKAPGGVYVGRASSDGVRCVAAVCVACGYQRGASVNTGRAPPPLGHLVKERRHSPNFFLFFLKREGVTLIYR